MAEDRFLKDRRRLRLDPFGGPPKDGIPSIDNPKFETLAGGKATGWSAEIGDTEAVIALALDAATVGGGRDVGNVIVRRKVGERLEDVPYDVTFAFVFHAFRPKGTLQRGKL